MYACCWGAAEPSHNKKKFCIYKGLYINPTICIWDHKDLDKESVMGVLHVRNIGQVGEGVLRERGEFGPGQPPAAQTDCICFNAQRKTERSWSQLKACGTYTSCVLRGKTGMNSAPTQDTVWTSQWQRQRCGHWSRGRQSSTVTERRSSRLTAGLMVRAVRQWRRLRQAERFTAGWAVLHGEEAGCTTALDLQNKVDEHVGCLSATGRKQWLQCSLISLLSWMFGYYH